ncbi:MAG TPA: tetratricopeptide repeat protein, partial [Gemmata sp.]|nr:tetratricopeptide repeat protein [Gemmata sp.]
EYLQTLGYSLAMAGSVSQDLGKPDASALLQTGLKELVEHTKRHPCEPQGVECLIRVHLAMSTVDGPDATDEHDRAVLELVEHQEKALGRQLRLTRLRAHALNNIASRLTNRGKTDEAEMYWRQVLAIREKLAGAAPYSKVYHFELATCLFNYANQLQKTERAEEARASREHAAKLYDPIRNDARKRTMYIPVIVRNDLLLADASSRRGETGKSIDRLTAAIELNKLVIDRNPTNLGSRAAHADALTARAELLEALGHHAEAAGELRAAISFSTKESHKDYCATKLVCVLVRSGQRAEAMTLAAELDPEKFTPPWLCVECARGWMLIARATANAQSIPPEEKDKTVAMAQTRARAAILAARKKGMFHEADEAKWFLSQKDFEPIWDVVARAKQ